MFKACNIHKAPIKIKIRPPTRYDLFFMVMGFVELIDGENSAIPIIGMNIYAQSDDRQNLTTNENHDKNHI